MAVAVSDIAAQAIALAIREQTTMLTLAIGPGSALNIGTIAHTVDSLVKAVPQQHDQLVQIASQLATLNTAIGTLATELDKNRTGLANLQVTMSRQVATQQLAVANDIRVAKFQEQTVNTALAEAGKPPIVVTPTNFADGVKASVEDISVINIQTTVSATVINIVSDAITEGIKISTQWAAQTAVGQFVTSYVTELKLKTKLLFAEEEAKAEIQKAINAVLSKRSGALL